MKSLLPRALVGVAFSVVLSSAASAADFTFKVVAKGLNRPTGIVAAGSQRLYFTEIPTPGVAGGANAVKELRLRKKATIRTVHQGEPEPVNISIDHCDVLYWTCKSAGVILEQAAVPGASAEPLLTGLAKPSGIAVGMDGRVYFTEVPTPGVGGGANKVSVVETDSGEAPLVLSQGEPEPTDIAVSRDGELYWTCQSAGVILHRDEAGVVASLLTGLNHPVGIALNRSGRFLYWTEVPTPGVAGTEGGNNKVWEYDLKKGVKKLVHSGDPEPTDITVADCGSLYWTCTSAGVIVEARRR